MTHRLTLPLLALLAAAGCGEAVDTTGLPPVVGYDQWYRLDVTGDVPGHGDTYRIIFVNDVGRAYPHAGKYRPGTVLVKEIHDLDGDQPGALRYVAIMRKLAEDQQAGLPVDDGWLFTSSDAPLGDETSFDYCWQRCHRAAPYAGAWYDYGE